MMTNILTKECDFEIENFKYKKIQNKVVNKYCIFKDQSQVFLKIISGNQLLYLLHRNKDSNWEPI